MPRRRCYARPIGPDAVGREKNRRPGRGPLGRVGDLGEDLGEIAKAVVCRASDDSGLAAGIKWFADGRQTRL
ncbi:hypothetical protein GCM10011611_59960 [Aliidongia dinghuensis]|uniref:Uncharacterized protein n=1 Tax=Aliidongia dinghuensis TaxID=1867774 RepID=A0A8J3E6K4_9PROT|nr:hypothetical protein GCM10011611_59960 [Aliidongia dinghuensis]